jgi:hypothetical protein
LKGAELAPKADLTSVDGKGHSFRDEVSAMNDKWNAEQANQLLRAALAEIDELGDKLSPARAEALLDEFEHDVCGAFLRQDISAVMANCKQYPRRFRALAEED